MEQIPKTETREDDLDRDFSNSCFDYFIDKFQSGELTYAEAIQAYTEVMIDKYENE